MCQVVRSKPGCQSRKTSSDLTGLVSGPSLAIGAVHTFGNSGSSLAQMLLITAPPGHERYFEEFSELLAKGGPLDPEALAALRRKYDTVQMSTLTSGS